MLADTHKPNLLLWFLILMSLGIHAAVFIRISGIHRPAAPVYIELDLRTESKPVQRTFPRPKPLQPAAISTSPRNFAEIPEPVQRSVQTPPLPAIEAAPLGPLPAGMQPPAIPAVKPLNIAVWKEKSEETKPQRDAAAGKVSPNTRAAYLQEVKKMIPIIAAEADRRYKRKARKRQIQGRTAVRVVIDADGKIVEATIAESSTHDMLDAIALKAVASASPFPKPSQAPVTIDIPITFKLK